MNNQNEDAFPHLSYKRALLPIAIVGLVFLAINAWFTVPKIIENFSEHDNDAAIWLIVSLFGIAVMFAGVALMKYSAIRKKRLEHGLATDNKNTGETQDKFDKLL